MELFMNYSYRKIFQVILFSIAGMVLLSCTKGGIDETPSQGSGGNNNPPAPPKPQVGIIYSPIYVYVPNNCWRSFGITNTGRSGSKLDYSVLDNGALGGFLDLTNASGRLDSGQVAIVSVRILPQFANTSGSSDYVLDIYTPGASNATHNYITIYRRNINEQINSMIGTWSGAWSGNSFGVNNPGQPYFTSPVSGNWSLNVQSVNLNSLDVSGTLSWTGTDAYWNYTTDGNGLITSATPQPFNATHSQVLTNAKIKIPVQGSGCDLFQFTMNQFTSTGYGVYGPKLTIDMNLFTNQVSASGSSWVAWPYAPMQTSVLSYNQSNGGLTGKKQ
jgi:hypothetical protein